MQDRRQFAVSIQFIGSSNASSLYRDTGLLLHIPFDLQPAPKNDPDVLFIHSIHALNELRDHVIIKLRDGEHIGKQFSCGHAFLGRELHLLLPDVKLFQLIFVMQFLSVQVFQFLPELLEGFTRDRFQYLIDYYDQLELLAQEKARGYFKQTEDISFPEWAEHKPINTVNRLKDAPDAECFVYDGGGFNIEHLTAPLFGKVSGAVIENVNVKHSDVNTDQYSDFGFIVCQAYRYQYRTEDGNALDTGETIIRYCTVSHSSFTAELPVNERETKPAVTEIITAPVVDVPDGIIVYDDEGNVISETQDTTEPPIVEPTKQGEFAVGAITRLGGQIEDCYVEDFSISANLKQYILYAGGISGKPANVLNSVVYNFDTHGKIFNAGGIAGSIGGARLYDPKGKELPAQYGGSIQGCSVVGASMQTELAAGGIAGEGSTDADHALISNCYAKALSFDVGVYQNTEKIKDGAVGGILGTDGKERTGHLIMNCVSPSEYVVIGMRTLSRFDDTVRLAPDYAFYQESMLTVVNRNTVHPDAPGEMFTGSFRFDSNYFTDGSGAVAYPAKIGDLFPLAKEDSDGE